MCGEPLVEIAGALTCVPGDMLLSEVMRRNLDACFVAKTRMPTVSFDASRFGDTWFCPGCGVQAQLTDTKITCPCCSRSLNEFLCALLELHPHRLSEAQQAEMDRWSEANRRVAPTWPRAPRE